MKLREAADKVEQDVEEALTYCDFPSEHWTKIRTNNVIERLNREIRRRLTEFSQSLQTNLRITLDGTLYGNSETAFLVFPLTTFS